MPFSPGRKVERWSSLDSFLLIWIWFKKRGKRRFYGFFCSWTYVTISILLVLCLSAYLCYDGRQTPQRHCLDEVELQLARIRVWCSSFYFVISRYLAWLSFPFFAFVLLPFFFSVAFFCPAILLRKLEVRWILNEELPVSSFGSNSLERCVVKMTIFFRINVPTAVLYSVGTSVCSNSLTKLETNINRWNNGHRLRNYIFIWRNLCLLISSEIFNRFLQHFLWTAG